MRSVQTKLQSYVDIICYAKEYSVHLAPVFAYFQIVFCTKSAHSERTTLPPLSRMFPQCRYNPKLKNTNIHGAKLNSRTCMLPTYF